MTTKIKQDSLLTLLEKDSSVAESSVASPTAASISKTESCVTVLSLKDEASETDPLLTHRGKSALISQRDSESASAVSHLNFGFLSAFGIYLVAYCVHPLLIDALKFQGAATPSTSIFLVPHYIAMILAGFFCKETIWNFKLTWSIWKKGLWIAFIDILHQIFEKAGLMYAGSAVYILISNSSIVWTAVISLLVLQRKLSFMQWLSLVLICIGLGLQGTEKGLGLNDTVSIGITLTSISAMLHALTSVTNEKYLKHSTEIIPGPILVFMMGVFNCGLLCIWLAVWTIPNWNNLVMKSIAEHNGNFYIIAALMIGLFLCSMVNALTQWYLMQQIGAVSMGVSKGLKATIVFFLGHVFFCHLQASQCLTTLKIFSAAVCASGVTAYSFVTTSEIKKTQHKTV